MSEAPKRGKGRPPIEGGRAEIVGVRLYPAQRERIKAWGATHGFPTLAGAIRAMIDKALEGRAGP